MKLLETYKVPKIMTSSEGTRLSDFACGIFQNINSKKGIKKAIKKGLVKVDGKIGFTGDYIMGGETIELFQEEKSNTPLLNLKLEILYEDDYLGIVNKPAGIVVSGNKFRTIENALNGNLQPSNEPDALVKPQAIHRLDYPTSGVLLIGKTRKTVIKLNQLFEECSIEKIYKAVCIGEILENGRINQAIDGKNSETYFTKIKTVLSPKFKHLSLVQLHPKNGRKHQLRIHLSNLGFPILGEKLYGDPKSNLKGKGLFLHANSLRFQHPITKQIVFAKADLPKKFSVFFPKENEISSQNQ